MNKKTVKAFLLCALLLALVGVAACTQKTQPPIPGGDGAPDNGVVQDSGSEAGLQVDVSTDTDMPGADVEGDTDFDESDTDYTFELGEVY